ncbi:glutathione S-transferase domain-containing protein [Xylariaceae sp. FL1272]|nr:glutathione S-transferase domain-containing protein [Xylariaceae sp. FL1272]
MAAATPQLKLYTNHGCPWAHRAHIALNELKLPFEEEIIDLSKPREPEYLKVNPRGLVPSLSVDGEIITESAIVAGYLADAFPSHLVSKSDDPKGALERAKIAFFVDTFMSKIHSPLMAVYKASVKNEDTTAGSQTVVDNAVKEIEPLLANAGPFFNGSDKLTFAEVLTGSFVIRLWTHSKYGLIPDSLVQDLKSKAPNLTRWADAVVSHPSVNDIYDEEKTATAIKAKLAKM